MSQPTSQTKNIAGFVALLAFVMAGSCAAPTNDGDGLVDRGADNHPIIVAPEYSALELPFSGSGLLPADEARFEGFIAHYKNSSNGSISISAPEGPGASDVIGYFGERLAALGVPRNKIMVSTRPGMAYGKVEIGFIGYQASVGPCGDWSKSIAYTATNRVTPNFGCANQKNLAAMVSDPRDLVSPRPMDPDANMNRRAVVLDKYSKGQITANEKNAANSASVSEVNKQ